MNYKLICKAILSNPKKEHNELTRKWIMLFEKTKVAGWNRDSFLECLIKYKKEMKGGDDDARKRNK